MQHLAADFDRELVRIEDALVDAPVRAVIQDALLPAHALLSFCGAASQHDQFGGDPAGLGQEDDPAGFFEVAVEVAREQPFEAAIRERQRERVADDERGVRAAPACNLDHRRALIEADELAGQMLRLEAGPARDIERARRRERGEKRCDLHQFILPARPLATREQTPAQPPVVVLRRALVVVLLHCS